MDKFLPIQYTEIFFRSKKCKFHWENIFAQNIHCGYTLQPLRRGSSNEYPQCMFLIKNKKKGIPLQTPVFFFCFVFYIKMGFKGVCILRTCFNGHVAAHYRFNSNPFMKVTAKLVIVKPSRLHLPRSSYDFLVCDFPYDFLDIAGDRGLRRLC